LKTIYGNLKDKSKVLVNKGIASVEHSKSGVTAICDDGSTYQGDILIGADGVRSTVREEMWRLADSTVPALVKNDKNGMSCKPREEKC
jgi:2-polyprenyl-6-methoxyphenol hydroxylase-like FAD-dependent oxidoreductase